MLLGLKVQCTRAYGYHKRNITLGLGILDSPCTVDSLLASPDEASQLDGSRARAADFHMGASSAPRGCRGMLSQFTGGMPAHSSSKPHTERMDCALITVASQLIADPVQGGQPSCVSMYCSTRQFSPNP